MKTLILLLILYAQTASGQSAVIHNFLSDRLATPSSSRRSSALGFRLIAVGNGQPAPEPPQGVNAVSAAPTPAFACDPASPSPAPRAISAATARRRFDLWPEVRRLECRYSLPAGLLDALLIQESRYRADAVSRAGAVGLGQLMPRTARELGVMDPRDPLSNIDGAARYLARQLTNFGARTLRSPPTTPGRDAS